tara:strand:- start:1215 stop:1808 length:594 start_codon:yes stop_codon:yes gene_type:complete
LKKLIYIEENFISPSDCKKLIDHADMVAVGHQEDTVPPGEPQEDDYDYAGHYARQDEKLDSAQYQGHADFIDMKGNTDELYNNVVHKVTRICKLFDDRANPDYVGVIKWTPGTFMKPHYDSSAKDGIYDLFAALLYLNDDFTGGHTGFEDFDITPIAGKLVIFSNSQHKHHVTRVVGTDRYALSFWYNTSTDMNQSV